MKHKKAQITSVLLFMLIIIVAAFTIVLARYIVTQAYDAFEESDMMTEAMTESKAITYSQFQAFDYSMIFMTVVLIIGLLITSFLIPTHPIYVVINIIGIFFLVFAGMILVNVYGELVSGEGAEMFGTEADTLPMTNYLIIYLPFIGAIVIALVSIIQFSRG